MRIAIAFALAALAVAPIRPAAAAASIPDLPTPTAQDLSGTRAMAMGNAFRAIATSNEAIYLNPAGMALQRKYEIDLAYAFARGDDLSRFNGSIVDSKTTRLATGLAYTHLKGDGLQGELSGSIVNLAFGLPVAERVALGFGFKYLDFAEPDRTNAITGDVGVLVQPIEWLSFAGVAYNVIDVDSREAPFRVGGGVAFGTDTTFRVALDTVADFTSDPERTALTYHAGGEYLFDGAMAIRGGFMRRDLDDRNYLSAGLGFISRAAAIEAAYVQSLEAGEGPDRTFSFTLKFFL
ncbi:MAG TPA: hypothetical protein VN033_08545 [Vulgatibacter sp.]|nr:hypothetical protein [Vulgatibacter sp.]